jgi:glycosyltransferase involved in cell wall biosynthesis
MAFGVPVVAFDLDETRRTVASAGVYATPNDPRSFAAAIDDLLSDPNRRREMGANGRSLVRGGLSWDHQRVAYVGVYDALLHDRSREPVRAANDRRFDAANRGAK